MNIFYFVINLYENIEKALLYPKTDQITEQLDILSSAVCQATDRSRWRETIEKLKRSHDCQQ